MVNSAVNAKERYQKVDIIYVTEKVEEGLVANPLGKMIERASTKLQEILGKTGADGVVGLRVEFENVVKTNGEVNAGKLIIYGTAVKFK